MLLKVHEYFCYDGGVDEKSKELIISGSWSKNISWKLYRATKLPPAELITAVMCVAIDDTKIVLACSDRGWGMLGGHIEDGETLDEALFREAREEGGFIIEKHDLFAVREITAKVRESFRPGKDYPFPVSYMPYYWATTNQPLRAPYGEEIIESGSFSLDDIVSLNTPDLPVIRAGWESFITRK